VNKWSKDIGIGQVKIANWWNWSVEIGWYKNLKKLISWNQRCVILAKPKLIFCGQMGAIATDYFSIKGW